MYIGYIYIYVRTEINVFMLDTFRMGGYVYKKQKIKSRKSRKKKYIAKSKEKKNKEN